MPAAVTAPESAKPKMAGFTQASTHPLHHKARHASQAAGLFAYPANTRHTATLPRSIFHQGQDSGRSIKRPWRGVQRVGFLAKWPESGGFGAFCGFGRFPDFAPSRGRARRHVLKFQHFKRTHHRIMLRHALKIQQMDRDRRFGNLTRRPTLRAWRGRAWPANIGPANIGPAAGQMPELDGDARPRCQPSRIR